MRKKTLIIVLLFLALSALYAQDPEYPSDNIIGKCVPSDFSEEHIFLSNALSQPYDFEWAESFMHPKFKKNLALVYSSFLSDLLPLKSVVYSRAFIGSDGTCVISVKDMESGKIVSFAIFDGLISAILN